jgi:hypothetical protein
MKMVCVFMLCASVSFSVIVLSCAAYEKTVSMAYALRTSADYQMFLMFQSPEKKVVEKESV